MSERESKTVFVPVQRAAAILGVPRSWLRAEVKAGRVPAVRTGRRIMIHIERAAAVLAERASQGEEVER